jgi:hypothetical protein
MSKRLERLIERARRYKMTPREREAQIHSFAYGNGHLENSRVTKAGIEKAMEALKRASGDPVRS